ncbi:unnamed protein product [Boreogadus saida]
MQQGRSVSTSATAGGRLSRTGLRAGSLSPSRLRRPLSAAGGRPCRRAAGFLACGGGSVPCRGAAGRVALRRRSRPLAGGGQQSPIGGRRHVLAAALGQDDETPEEIITRQARLFMKAIITPATSIVPPAFPARQVGAKEGNHTGRCPRRACVSRFITPRREMVVLYRTCPAPSRCPPITLIGEPKGLLSVAGWWVGVVYPVLHGPSGGGLETPAAYRLSVAAGAVTVLAIRTPCEFLILRYYFLLGVQANKSPPSSQKTSLHQPTGVFVEPTAVRFTAAAAARPIKPIPLIQAISQHCGDVSSAHLTAL